MKNYAAKGYKKQTQTNPISEMAKTKLSRPLNGFSYIYPLANFLEVGHRIFTVREVFLREKEDGLPYTNLVAIHQRCLIVDFSIVDKYTVFALHVERGIFPGVFVEMDLHVFSGDTIIEDLN